MTNEERERMHVLCGQIETEKDPEIFSQLVNELDELMSRKASRLGTHTEHEKDSGAAS